VAYVISKVVGISDMTLVLLGSLLPHITFVSLIILSRIFKINKHKAYLYTAPFHTPFMMMLLSATIATATTGQGTAFIYLLLGTASHFILDLLSKGGYVELFYPFSMTSISLKVFWPESISGYILLIGSSISVIFAVLNEAIYSIFRFQLRAETILLLTIIFIITFLTKNLIREEYTYFKFSDNPEQWEGKQLSFHTRYVKSVEPLEIDIADRNFEAVTNEQLKIGDQISFEAKYSKGRLYITALHKHNTLLKTVTSLLGLTLFLLIIVF